jgi:hypothetical protein
MEIARQNLVEVSDIETPENMSNNLDATSMSQTDRQIWHPYTSGFLKMKLVY